MNEETERELFEAHFKYLDFERTHDAWDREVYLHPHVQSLFEGFQAGRASLPASDCIERKVYRNSPEREKYLAARFPMNVSADISFNWDGHRWMYKYTSFDDNGDYDLLTRPNMETQAQGANDWNAAIEACVSICQEAYEEGGSCITAELRIDALKRQPSEVDNDFRANVERIANDYMPDSDKEAPPELWQHVKSGSLYEFVMHAFAEADAAPVVVYRATDASKRVWVRSNAEFYDGRFVRVKCGDFTNGVSNFCANLASQPEVGKQKIEMIAMRHEDGRPMFYVDTPEFYCDIEQDENEKWSVYFRDLGTNKEAFAEQSAPEGWRERLGEMRYTYSQYPELAQDVFDSVIEALEELELNAKLKTRIERAKAGDELLRMALQALRKWNRLIDYQYTASREAISALQEADNEGEAAIAALISHLEANEGEGVRIELNALSPR